MTKSQKKASDENDIWKTVNDIKNPKIETT